MKRHAPATGRNSAAIHGVLSQILPAKGTVLEIASGTGEHAVYMSRKFPDLIWQPSDQDEASLLSIAEWRADAGPSNLAAPIVLDAASERWPVEQADAIFCCNMVHISPWCATAGLFRGAARLLDTNAPLILYGPFIDPGVPTAPSNQEFDVDLKRRNPEWGLRSIPDLDAVAQENDFTMRERYSMPANNCILLFRKV